MFIKKLIIFISFYSLIYSQNLENKSFKNRIDISGEDSLQIFKSSDNISSQNLQQLNEIKSFFEENGITAEISYKLDVFTNPKSQTNKKTAYADNIDLIFNTDFSKLLNWDDGRLLIHILGNHGGSPCNLVGASQGVSNIEAYPTWKIYQVIFEKNFFYPNLNFAIGLYDLNSEFDTRETSSIFINPSHGIGDEIAKSGLNGPSIFPNTSLGIRFKYDIDDNKKYQFAILDGVPGNPNNPNGTQIILNRNDGVLAIQELQFVTDEYNFSFGSWIYSKEVGIYLVKNKFENDFGFYFSAEKFDLISNDNIDGFFRIGTANKSANPVDFYFGIGLRLNEVFSKMNMKDLGIACAVSHNSVDFRRLMAKEMVRMKEYEVNLEFTYKIGIFDFLEIQPDFQYIINPTYCTIGKNQFVIGMRVLGQI